MLAESNVVRIKTSSLSELWKVTSLLLKCCLRQGRLPQPLGEERRSGLVDCLSRNDDDTTGKFTRAVVGGEGGVVEEEKWLPTELRTG